MAELREFVYIDKDSLNNNLSSLGRGIPSEVTRSTEDQTEKGGSAGGRLAGIGGEGEYRTSDSEQIETRLDITAPYRFQDLLDAIDEAEIDIKENPDPRGTNRSDLVKITGEFHPMALLKFDMALDAFGIFMGQEFNEGLKELGSDPVFQPEQEKQFQTFGDIIEKFSGNEYPVRVENDGNQYCIPLERSNMRTSVYEAFQETTEYTVYGRVERHIPGNEEWQPVHALDVLSEYTQEEGKAKEFLDDMEDSAEQMNISISEDDKRVRGHTAVVDPIAIYW